MTDRRIGLLPPTKTMEEYKGQIDGPDGVSADDLDTIKKMNELGKNYHLRTQDGGRSTIIEDDPVDSPSHYKGGRVEVIDFLEDYVPDFRLANVVKYIARAGVKDPNKFEQDIKKAQWYLNRYIEKEFNDADSGNESKS